MQASKGIYPDESGPCMARLLQSMSDDAEWPLTVRVDATAIVPDEPGTDGTVFKKYNVECC